jgi:cell division protein FtsL
VRDEGVVRLGRLVDNSQVVRQVDPRTRREIWGLILLIAVLAGAVGLYAWPALEIRRAGLAAIELEQEKERLLEENRKLSLEKAALANLSRVETIARRDLGLQAPAPERSVVVEVPPVPPPGSRVADEDAPARQARVGAGGGERD